MAARFLQFIRRSLRPPEAGVILSDERIRDDWRLPEEAMMVEFLRPKL
jgi:hypothetical protein